MPLQANTTFRSSVEFSKVSAIPLQANTTFCSSVDFSKISFCKLRANKLETASKLYQRAPEIW